ncbi:5-oxoprolinase subunit C family protein [Thalassotalea ganghwensis]
MSSFIVQNSGISSILVDKGRFGYGAMGLAQGGPADENAFYWLNRLLDNDNNAVAIECTLGGIELKCTSEQVIAVTGANAPLFIDGIRKANWCSHNVKAGAKIKLGYAKQGTRVYLGVQQGFTVSKQFGSATTVVKDSVGGLNGDALSKGDSLPCQVIKHQTLKALSQEIIPRYHQQLQLGIVVGYQAKVFCAKALKQFFNQAYRVTEASNRMGYRLSGKPIEVPKAELTSEGICYGAVQVPQDGQPIVLLNDRQTIGGYHKLGSILSLDGSKLSQCQPGAQVSFYPLSAEQAIAAVNKDHQWREKQLLLDVI